MGRFLTLTQAYLICFGLLAMWAVFAYITMSTQIKGQQQYAELINVSGKQRMLSQRTSLYAYHYLQSRNEADLIALVELKELMQRDHLYLVDHLPSAKIRALYFPDALDSKVNGYFELLDLYLAAPDMELADQVQDYSNRLLPELDGAVADFEQESDTKTARLMRLEGYILSGSLLTLILEALFILRPALRTANIEQARIDAIVKKQTEHLQVFQELFSNTHDGIMITDRDNKVVDLNPAFEKITGYSEEDIKGHTPSILKSTHLEPLFYENFWRDLYKKDHWTGEFINRRKDGSVYYQLSYIFLIRDDSGKICRHVAIIRDISALKEGASRLEYLALYDVLTGLPNRTYLQSQIQKGIERAKRFSQKLAVVLLDLDGFKEINDSLGHRIGDLVLKNVGQVLQSGVRGIDTVARIGGDEFVLLIEQVHGRKDVIPLVEELLRRLIEPQVVEGHKITVAGSVGISLYPLDAKELGDLLEHADAAMYYAKKHGKGHIQVYDHETMAEMFESASIGQMTDPK